MKIEKVMEIAEAKAGVERGEKWEWTHIDLDNWRSVCSGFDWSGSFTDSDSFRKVKEPKLRPWKPEEVPVGSLISKQGWLPAKGMILGHTWSSGSDGIFSVDFNDPGIGTKSEKTNSLLEKYIHSTDGGKTWKPCGVEE